MRRISVRARVVASGTLEVIDPGFDTLPLIRAVNPDYSIATEPLPGFSTQRLQRTRELSSGLAPAEAEGMALDALVGRHREVMDRMRESSDMLLMKQAGELSVLALKLLIARRMLANCRLCARRCGVDRTKGTTGPCGLTDKAYVAEHFVHIAEEPPINPSLLLSLRGCGLRCRYCQQHELLDANGNASEELGAGLWDELEMSGARSLSFIGGNPDESLAAILGFLAHAPRDFGLPVVWNHHAYATPEAIDLLDQVVDCYVPDLKYGNNECAMRLSSVARYCEVVHAAIRGELEQGVPVIVRLLVLPAHMDCCHRPALEFLAALPRRDLLTVSIRGQYVPDWQMSAVGEELGRRTTRAEFQAVLAEADRLALPIIGARS